MAFGASLLGGVFGCLAFRLLDQVRRERGFHRALALRLGSDQPVRASRQVTGLPAALVSLMEQESRKYGSAGLPQGLRGKLMAVGSRRLKRLAAQAGLSQSIGLEGMLLARGKVVAISAITGAVLGLALSWQLCVLLALSGAALGFASIPWALGAEIRARQVKVESELSGMLEVVCLGLQAGLSFERSIDLYCRHFPTFLAGAFKGCLRQWEWGLVNRDDALRQLASEFDSPIFTRTVESMVRSLRFGVAMAPVLEEIAREAREVRKAHLEERVAKAPVKMMVPVGALILPAMLLIVLGPVLLELMEGF